MPAFPTSGFSAVFAHFGVRPTTDHSCYPWAPVFPVDFEGRRAVLKRTATVTGEAVSRWCRALAADGVPVVAPLAGPALIGERRWVVYPWVDGRPYRGLDDLAAAGELLGRLHTSPVQAHGLASFPWPDLSCADPAADLPRLAELLTRHAPLEASRLMARLGQVALDFPHRTLPAMRAADLPVVPASNDFRAVNLVYAEVGPVLVDPDNALLLPRVLDLAFAVLMFHHEAAGAPGRPFDAQEWRVFRDAYLSRVDLVAAERRSWPDALDYVLWEEGTWAVEDSSEWEDRRQRAFLVNLAGTPRGAFPLE